MGIVAVLALISPAPPTRISGLLLALVRPPDYSTPLDRSQARLRGSRRSADRHDQPERCSRRAGFEPHPPFPTRPPQPPPPADRRQGALPRRRNRGTSSNAKIAALLDRTIVRPGKGWAWTPDSRFLADRGAGVESRQDRGGDLHGQTVHRERRADIDANLISVPP